MIYNLVVLAIILSITFTSINKSSVGMMVACYYGVYILIDLDVFFTIYDIDKITYAESMVWYLIYTATTFLFFIVSVCIYVYEHSKTAIFYACWLLLNLIVSGFSAIAQAYETNSFLIVYNIIQNINLIVDIIVVIIGTDNMIRRSESAGAYIDSASVYLDSYLNINATNSHGAS